MKKWLCAKKIIPFRKTKKKAFFCFFFSAGGVCGQLATVRGGSAQRNDGTEQRTTWNAEKNNWKRATEGRQLLKLFFGLQALSNRPITGNGAEKKQLKKGNRRAPNIKLFFSVGVARMEFFFLLANPPKEKWSALFLGVKRRVCLQGKKMERDRFFAEIG